MDKTKLEGEDLDTWEDFEKEMKALYSELEVKKAKGRYVSRLLFRGHANQEWKLSTTLERYTCDKKQSLIKYCQTISNAKMEIETFTEKEWDIMSFKDYKKHCQSRSDIGLKTLPGYGYMAHLRHHGFPSPLLDWTQSQHIAAYFAFSKIDEDVKNVSIYAYCEHFGFGKLTSSDEPKIISHGHNTKAHPRHYRQQSEYTICVVRGNTPFYYANHEDVFKENEPEQDRLWKFNIPATERMKVMKLLDSYNLNAFSLFGSEESLMETIALKELYLNDG